MEEEKQSRAGGRPVRRTETPEAVADRIDKARRSLLEAGALFAATRASIVLAVILARFGRQEEIQTVIDELRRAVRKARRQGEIVFALYHVTNAVAWGADVEEAAAEALVRLRRCRLHLERNRKRNHPSGADSGVGFFERRSSMKTQQMVQELKAERVQEELAMVEEPYQIAPKAERVQEPLAVAGAVPLSSAFELTISQKQPVSIELLGHQIVITLHGANAGQAG